MYALFDAHETSHCSFSVSQVLCTNWRFLLRYSWLITRVQCSSRRWGQDLPSKALTMSLSLRQSLKDLSVERAIDVIDRMGAISTCQSSCCDAGRQTLYSFQSWNSALPFWFRTYCPRGKDLDLDGNASWMFWIPISFKIQAGVFLWFAILDLNTYGSILMIGHRHFAVVEQTVDFIHALVLLTACIVSHLWYAWFHHLLQRNQSPNKRYSSLAILAMLIKA